MRRLKDILLLSFLSVCAVGCIDDTDQLPELKDVSYINLQISTGASTGSSQTRADSDVKSQSGENKINSVKVWMFGTCLNEAGVTQGSRELVGYAEDTNFGFEVTESKLYEYIQIAVANKYLVNKNQTVDIYVIANAESVGLGSLGEGTSETDLQAAVIGQAYFGATNPVSGPTYISGETAATSLPASRIVNGVKLADLKPDLTAENRAKIVLQRAVSRIRFFAVKDAADTDLKLEGITIKGYKAAQGDEAGHDGFIPDRINIFPESVTYNSNRNALDLTTHGSWPKATVAQIPGDAVYTTSDIVYSTAGESAVAVDKYVENVETYFTKGTDETWQAYSDRLENNTNLYNVTYLRETVNKPLSVTIYYNGKDQTFQLTEDIQKLFLRNSDIIVGMYLSGGKLEIKPFVLPWDYNSTNEYKTHGGSALHTDETSCHITPNVEDTNGDGVIDDNDIKWAEAHTAIAYSGFQGGGTVNPGYNVMLYLTSSFDSEATMTLMLDNTDDFGFTYVKDNQYSAIMDAITIGEENSTIDTNGDYKTYFYVVPKPSAPEGARTTVSLVLTSGTIVTKLPFNASLMPGGNNTQVWYEVVSVDNYNNNTYTYNLN